MATKNRAGDTATEQSVGRTMTVRPALRRNPRAPVFFSPIVDVRVTDRDIRMLSFVVPPADPREVVQEGPDFVLPIQSQAEFVLPLDTAVQLIAALTAQVEGLRKKLG